MARLRSTPGAQNVEGAGSSTTATRQITTRATRSQTRSVSVDPESVRPSRTTRQASIERDGRGKNNQRNNVRGNDGRTQGKSRLGLDMSYNMQLSSNVSSEIIVN